MQLTVIYRNYPRFLLKLIADQVVAALLLQRIQDDERHRSRDSFICTLSPHQTVPHSF